MDFDPLGGLRLLCDTALSVEAAGTTSLGTRAVLQPGFPANNLAYAPLKCSSLRKIISDVQREAHSSRLISPTIQLKLSLDSFPSAAEVEEIAPGDPAKAGDAGGRPSVFRKKKRTKAEMDKDGPPKISRADQTCEKLLAINEVNPYQYSPGREYSDAWKRVYGLIQQGIKPGKPASTGGDEKIFKAEMHNLQCLVTAKIKEFRKAHAKNPGSGTEEEPMSALDMLCESLEKKKESKPPAALKPRVVEKTAAAIMRDHVLGMGTGRKITEDVFSVKARHMPGSVSLVALDSQAGLNSRKEKNGGASEEDLESGPVEVTPGYPAGLEKQTKMARSADYIPEAGDKPSKLAGRRIEMSKDYHKAFLKNSPPQDQDTTGARRFRTTDLIQTFSAAISQLDEMRDAEKEERKLEAEERKKDREWQERKFEMERDIRKRELDIREQEIQQKDKDRQILLEQTATTREIVLSFIKK